MHIPDGFLSSGVIIGTYAISASCLAYSLYRVKNYLDEKMVPIISVFTAFIFAAQMINFPVPGGTSGHLVGASLVSILFGPLPGFLIITIVLIIQCFFFADGGITALGANILNMAIVGGGGGYILYTILCRFVRNKIVCAAIGSAIGVVLAAICAALELAISKTAPLVPVFIAMAGWHILIGIGEGIITAFAIAFIHRWLPEITGFEKV
ncbi:MAG: energy-coupling factor ABC transporter permease [Planctomycetota bacterium]